MSRYIDAEEAYKVITEVYPLLQKGLLKQVDVKQARPYY